MMEICHFAGEVHFFLDDLSAPKVSMSSESLMLLEVFPILLLDVVTQFCPPGVIFSGLDSV